MLNYNPSKRPTISEIKKHPWMQETKNYDEKDTKSNLLSILYAKKTDENDNTTNDSTSNEEFKILRY